MQTIEPGRYADMDAATYHADRGVLSYSGAKLLLPPSCPAKFRWLMDNPPKPKRQYDFGHAAHKFVLGEGEEIVPVHADDWRTKDAQAQRDSAHAEGKAPLLSVDVDKAIAMADIVSRHPIAGPLFRHGRPEVAMYADDRETGMRIRGRADWIANGAAIGIGERHVIADYKTCVDASPYQFARAAARYLYHLQAAWYLDLAAATTTQDGDTTFLLVAQEKTPPYLVSVMEFDTEAITEGRRLKRSAIDLYAQCVAADSWPGFDPAIQLISLPLWAVDDEMEIEP